MTTTFNKVALSLVLAAFAFGIFTYASQQTNLLPEAFALGTGGCGSCGGGGSSSGGDGSSGEDRPPICTISASASAVQAGDKVTITWSASNRSNTTRLNGQSVNWNGSKVVTVNADRTFTVTGAGVGGNCSAKVTVKAKSTPAPVCKSFAFSKRHFDAEGGVAVATWSTKNASTVRINNSIGEVAKNQTTGRNIRIPANTTTSDRTIKYVMTVLNDAGQKDQCAVTVVVNGKDPVVKGCTDKKATNYNPKATKDDGSCKYPAVVPSCDLFTVNKAKVYQGGTVVLKWKTTNATKVTINNGIGAVNANNTSGRNYHMPTKVGTYTFTLTAVSKDGKKVSCHDKVEVIKKPVTEVPGCTDKDATNYNPKATKDDGSCKYPVVVPACDMFTVNKTTVYQGQKVVFKWETTNAINVSIDNGIGNVKVDNTAGRTYTMPTKVGTYTFTLTAVSKDQKVRKCATTVKVIKKPDTKIPGCTDKDATNYNPKATEDDGSCKYPETKTPKCDFFRVDDDEVRKGTEVTLSWGTTHAERVEIDNGIGRVNEDGEYDVVVNNDIDFKLTVYGKDGQKDTCTVDVNVESGGGGGSPLPKCEFKASDTRIKAGDRVELSWETRYGNELTIYEGDEDDGDDIYDTDDDDDVEEGEITVRPTRDTTYTLVVERGSRDRKCDVDIRVDDDEDDEVTVIDDRDQTPRVAGITLTQVPYTGFEAGPMLTLLFYALLALWGLFVAYHFVIRKKDSKLY